MLGFREPHIYGSDTLADINARLLQQCLDAGHQFTHLQSNAESELIDRLHGARSDGTAFMIVNFGGFTHTSISLRDAMLAVEIPFIEVHLSNLHSREEFRHNSYFSDIATACLFGFGAYGYELAIHAANRHITNAEEK